MEILDVYPKDLHIKLEISAQELDWLLGYLGNSVMSLDPKDEEAVGCANFVKETFYPLLDKLSHDLDRNRG